MKFVPAGVTRAVGRALLITQKQSPALLFGAGVAGMVGSTVLACRATLKIEEVLQKAQEDLYTVNSADITPEYREKYNYSLQDAKRDKAIVYVRTVAELGKLYAPAILVGVASVAALTQSHHILTKRNAALTAAYAALFEDFGSYRKRVIEEYGEEKDRDYRYGMQEVEHHDTKTGKKTKTGGKTRPTKGGSIYAKFFDKNSPSWSQTPEYNIVFLRCQQNWWNDRLQAKGHVFLNEVYDSLGLERTKQGSIVGWVRGQGDDYIDFNVFDSPACDTFYEFLSGEEDGIWLDFNVDGVIYNKI